MSQDLGLRHRNSKVKMYEITLLTSLRQPASHYLLSKKLEKQREAEEPPLPAGQFRLLMNLCVERTSNSGQESFSLSFYLFFFSLQEFVWSCFRHFSLTASDFTQFHPFEKRTSDLFPSGDGYQRGPLHFSQHSPQLLFSTFSVGNFNSAHSFPSWE